MNKQDDGGTVFFRKRIVFLDIETTGLDPETEKITEIGAVAVENDTVVDRYHTMVNPEKPIPAEIEQLCGLTDEDLAGAPLIDACRGDLARFIGDSPVVAHFAEFERKFFRSHGLPQPSVWLDSLPMAALLRPDMAEHNLDALIRETGIRDAEVHRGQEDAEDTFRVLLAFCRADRMPEEYWNLLHDLLLPPDSGWSFLFDHLAAAAGGSRDSVVAGISSQHFEDQPARYPVRTVDDVFRPGGAASREPGFRHRPKQADMARAVADTLATGRVQMIESGTGTGKSLAYLVPAALAAFSSGMPVAVSTHTRNLQHQLATRELPRLRRILGRDLRWVVLKGRENYICVERVRHRLDNPDPSDDPADRLMLGILWGATLHSQGSGDLDHFCNWVMRHSRHAASILAESRHTGLPCVSSCPSASGCKYMNAMKAAERAHILVINHALALAWPKSYPGVRSMVFDEAHALEDAATSAFGNALDRRFLLSLHYRIWHSKRGFLERLAACGPVSTASKVSGTDGVRDRLVTWAGTHEAMIREATINLGDRLAGHRFRKNRCDDNIDDGQFRRIVGVHTLSISVVLQADLLEVIDHLLDFYRKLKIEMDRFEVVVSAMTSELAAEWRSLVDRIAFVRLFLQRFVTGAWKSHVYSIEYSCDGSYADFALKEQPVTVAFGLKELWDRLNSVVLTSATLMVNRKPDFYEFRLGIRLLDPSRRKTAQEFDSPFHYDRQMLAVQPADLPVVDWRQPKPGLMAHRTIIRHVARHFHGRTLVLMASMSRLRILAEWLRDDLQRDRLVVLQQGMGNRERIVDAMRRNKGTILVGVRSFWEGVDIPGDALQAVTIEKVPFGPFHDPLIEARKKACDRSCPYGGFNFYQLPLALVLLRQGIGRLIRSETDEGLVLFLHPSVPVSYREQLSEAFPTCLQTGMRWPGVLREIQRQFPAERRE